jgi:hypothetical protein
MSGFGLDERKRRYGCKRNCKWLWFRPCVGRFRIGHSRPDQVHVRHLCGRFDRHKWRRIDELQLHEVIGREREGLYLSPRMAGPAGASVGAKVGGAAGKAAGATAGDAAARNMRQQEKDRR